LKATSCLERQYFFIAIVSILCRFYQGSLIVRARCNIIDLVRIISLRFQLGASKGALGGIILFVYGIIPTLQPAEFGRVYAAYGGIFIVSSIIWGRIVDKKKSDRYEIIGSIVAVFGAAIIFYSPR
jgi:small multidrug resistance family-3 protein